MRVSVVQMNAGADKARNIEQAARLIGAAVEADRPSIVALPEMWTCLGGDRATKFREAEALPPRGANAATRSRGPAPRGGQPRARAPAPASDRTRAASPRCGTTPGCGRPARAGRPGRDRGPPRAHRASALDLGADHGGLARALAGPTRICATPRARRQGAAGRGSRGGRERAQPGDRKARGRARSRPTGRRTPREGARIGLELRGEGGTKCPAEGKRPFRGSGTRAGRRLTRRAREARGSWQVGPGQSILAGFAPCFPPFGFTRRPA